ncbi:MAG: ABC transporter permease subunit [Chitinophagaceae bacterium]
MICKKEWQQFFNSITGYAVIGVFLLLNSLLLFVFPDTSILQFGYASLSSFFDYAPWVLLFLIPAITMRSFSEEYKSGTFELLKTLPLTESKIVWGKFLGCLLVVLTALLPTLVYAFSIQALSSNTGIDVAATFGSYIALFFLAAVYTAVGVCVGSYTNNTVVAFITSAFACFILYSGFGAISKLPFIKGSYDYFTEMLGINFHYKSMSRGVIDTRDAMYFIALIIVLLVVTQRRVSSYK